MPGMSKFTLIVTLVLMGFGASGGRITHFIRTSYPADMAQREALSRCSISDSKFSRFSEEERLACYRQNHVAAAVPPGERSASPAEAAPLIR